MIELGNYNALKINRSTRIGLFLEDGEGTEIFLPNKYVPASFQIGDILDVFCYLDSNERPIATTLNPLVIRNTFAFLQVASVNQYGAFLDWGLEKHLFVPFREQLAKMKEGERYVVYCYLDEESFRLMASMRLNRFLSNENLDYTMGNQVNLLISRKTDLGFEAVVDNKHKGLIFYDDVFKEIQIGDSLKGYVKNIRPDKKIDLSLEPFGFEKMEPAVQMIYDKLLSSNGYLALHDKTAPQEIKNQLQMSKKTFKKAIGSLYRARKIVIKNDGIYLI
ncbi:MAG: S1-like domain-containing RNA-binding protein [Bacteroidota bacterium]